jgi:predicted hotdog family 3-hydroxylacyl-ACP dehydratase
MAGSDLPPIADLLPHGPPMILLDDVVGRTEDGLTAAVTIRSDSQFAVPGAGVPAHVGIEYMAQACGAFAGLEAVLAKQPVRLGFLLGTRRFQAFVPWLREGWLLTVTVTTVFREDQMAVFDCCIRHETTEIATAQITVYQPDDPASVLANER